MSRVECVYDGPKEMSNICGGTAFAIAEWEIFGSQHKCRGNLLQAESNGLDGARLPCPFCAVKRSFPNGLSVWVRISPALDV